MASAKYALVCENQEIRYVRDKYEELPKINYCQNCSTKLHKNCLECGSAVIINEYVQEDGSVSRYVKNYCYECGNAYPWGPGRIGQWLDRTFSSTGPQNPTPEGSVVKYEIKKYLEDTKYGDEIITHVSDGDKCYNNKLWFPSLTMYVHAFEWAAITYLEDQTGRDIIEREREGANYYLVGSQESNSILDELNRNVEIDQKTLALISNMNRLERRWVAHHKSGETLQKEVDSVRGRLKIFVETLFESPAEMFHEEMEKGDV